MLKSIRMSGRSIVWMAAVGVCLLSTASSFAAKPIKIKKCESVTTLEKCVLKVCLYPGFKPFTWQENGAWSGWDVDYLKKFAGQYDFTFQAVRIPDFKGIWILPGAADAKCDIAASGISDIPARRNESPSTVWSKWYYNVDRSFLVRSGNTLNSIDDLKGKKVTVIVTKDSTADTDLQYRMQLAGKDNFSGVTIAYTDQEEKAAKSVHDGTAFAYGGGYGSNAVLAQADHTLKVTWAHCNMVKVGNGFKEYSEPFSFVVRSKDTGLSKALDSYINPKHPYPGTKNPDKPHCDPPKPSK